MKSSKSEPTRRDLLRTTAGAVAAAAIGTQSNADSKPAYSAKQDADRPLHYQTLAGIADRIATGDIDSLTVTQAMLARIRRLEPKLHAYYGLMEESALEQAATADEMRKLGKARGPLHGVPVAVKDLCHKTGTPTTAGHSFRRNALAETDATVVSRLEAAGAVLLGKLATTEGAMAGYHRDFEVPRNPWGDLDRWPGVSSGGSGVGTAAGLCYASLGTDTGGSIRFPSAANGIVGLKPTWGRVSRHGVLDLAPTLDHVGPMTRSVRDAARVLGVIAGLDDKDPTSLSSPVPDYEAELALGVKGLRIGWDEKFATKDVEPYVASAVTNAISQLSRLGAKIVKVTMPRMKPAEEAAWTTLAAAEAAAVHEATFPAQADEYGNYFADFLAGGVKTTSVELSKAIIARKNAAGRAAAMFQDIDLFMCPTLASESFRYDPNGAYNGIDTERGTAAGVPAGFFERNTRFIIVWDFNGYPTLSVPCGFSPDGIPLSVQMVGVPLAESVLCRAGYAFEQANDFHLSHPQLG